MRDVLTSIPYGHREPLKRSNNKAQDRRERKEVERANLNGDCIINVGNGWYRPVPGDAVDEKEFTEYLAKELSRARAILVKRMKMKEAFAERSENDLQTDNQRQTG